MRVSLFCVFVRSVVLTVPDPMEIRRELVGIVTQAHDDFPPNFIKGEEYNWENTPFGRVGILYSMAMKDASTIFAAYCPALDKTPAPSSSRKRTADNREDVVPRYAPTEANVVIKYSNDWLKGLNKPASAVKGHRHPLLNEYGYLKVLEPSGIVPKTYFLSGASSFPSRYPFSPRGMSKNVRTFERFKKLKHANTEVRFMVQEKVGMTLSEFFFELNSYNGPNADVALVRAAIAMGEKTLNLLERLHQHGIIHGDIHGGNIALKDPHFRLSMKNNVDFSKLDLVLIDFGKAVFFPDQIGTPEKDEEPDHALNDWFLSAWQLENYRKSFRDDVIRVMDQMANWLSGGALKSGFFALTNQDDRAAQRDNAAEIKHRLPFFKPCALLGSQALRGRFFLSLEKRAKIQNHLESIRSNMLQQFRDPNAPIAFLSITTDLRSVLAHL